MVLIFSASGDERSFQRSSRLIAPVVRWLLPRLSEEAVGAVVFGVRKCAHMAEYAVLAMLSWRALKSERLGPGWSWVRAGQALLIVALYAVTDELHQSFVPTRQGSVWDVLIDSFGGALGLLFLWVFGRWLKRW